MYCKLGALPWCEQCRPAYYLRILYYAAAGHRERPYRPAGPQPYGGSTAANFISRLPADLGTLYPENSLDIIKRREIPLFMAGVAALTLSINAISFGARCLKKKFRLVSLGTSRAQQQLLSDFAPVAKDGWENKIIRRGTDNQRTCCVIKAVKTREEADLDFVNHLESQAKLFQS